MTSIDVIFLEKEGRDILLGVYAVSKEDGSALSKFFETVTQSQSMTIWNKLCPAISDAVSSVLASNNSNVDELLHTLTAAAKCVKSALALSTFKPAQIKAALLDLSRFMGSFDDECAEASALRNSISSICEACIIVSDGGSEHYLPSTITFLLRESLRADAKDSYLKRLLAIKHGFEALDFSRADQVFIKDLLLRCFVHPNYLKCAEARKFLTELIAMSSGFLCDAVCQVIKVQIASGSVMLASQYGGILYKAWKDNLLNSPAFSRRLQENIQTYVHEGIYAENAKRFKGLKQLMKSFHDVTRTDQFNLMLVEIYDPIIWRSLRCANATVRSQAAVFFLDVFPLQKISPHPEESDRLLQKQFDMLTSLLKDDDQRVRAIVTTGVTHILREYWDMLPSATIQNLLKYIFDTLAFDVSSANVRYAVVMGLQDLLQQPLSHKALKGLLPIIKNYIHDRSERVRVAFVQLLNTVKNIQDIVFYDIVPADHLLARLAEDRDNDELSSGMTELLLNSFFPQNSTDKLEKVHRCIQFVNENPLAAEAFYRHLYKHSSVGSVAKLAAMLFTVLLTGPSSPVPPAAVEPTGKNAKRQRNGGKKAPALVTVAEDVPAEASLISDVPCFLKVLRVAAVLVQSIQPVLKDHASSLELLLKYVNVGGLRQLLAVAMSQPSHREYLVAGTLQLISATSAVESSIAEGFSCDMLLNEVFIPQLQLTEDESTVRTLTSCFVDAALSMGFEVNLLQEMTQALMAFTSNLRGKKLQEQSMSLHAVSLIALVLVEKRCQGVATRDSDNKVHKHYNDLWEHLKSLLAMIITPPKKKDSTFVAQQDQEACAALFRAWASYNVLLDAKSGLAVIVEPELTASQYLQDMVTWLFSAIPKLERLSAEQMILANDLLSTAMLVLLDSIDLLSKPAFIADELLRYLDMMCNVCTEEKSGPVSDAQRRKALMVCDRIVQQFGKIKAWGNAMHLEELTLSIDALMDVISGFVSEDDTAMHSMFQRCMKFVGSKTAERSDSISKVTKGHVANNENVLCN